MAPTVTLLTDFGLEDSYAAVLKAVILRLAPEARVVDITHYAPAFNILSAAYILKTAFPHFPDLTVHMVVVDPGVGSTREPIAIRTENAFFVGPDNGVFSFVAAELEILAVHRIENPAHRASAVSNTFHGRDIFAPAAAALANGVPMAELGPPLEGVVKLPEAFAAAAGERVNGAVIHIDSFGNLVTNITADMFPDPPPRQVTARVGGCAVMGLRDAFYQAEPGEIAAYLGSSGHLELGANRANAARTLNVGLGAEVALLRKHAQGSRSHDG